MSPVSQMGPKKRANAATPSSSSPSPAMKFRPVLETGRWAAKGTKPLPEPFTISDIFTKMIVYGCKKVVFLNPTYRIVGYAVLLFFVSLVSDYLPFPRSYFSSSSNILNQYFVKLSWMWTISLLTIFIGMTSSVYCCGKGALIARQMSRLLIATVIWFVWTSLFQMIEEGSGQCLFTPTVNSQTPTILLSKGRRHCLKNGGKWTSLDISGHSFILIWCTLFITEECKAILGWDTITDFIRNEDHKRTTAAGRRISELTSGIATSETVSTEDDTPISHLTPEEFDNLKKFYGKFGFWAKISLLSLTLLTLLWDGMLIATACYYHIMIEKVLAGLIAVIMWFCTYRGFYTWDVALSPGLPAVGVFKYTPSAGSTTTTSSSEVKANVKAASSKSSSSRQMPSSQEDVPSFMGMPIYPRKNMNSRELGGSIIGMEGLGVSK